MRLTDLKWGVTVEIEVERRNSIFKDSSELILTDAKGVYLKRPKFQGVSYTPIDQDSIYIIYTDGEKKPVRWKAQNWGITSTSMTGDLLFIVPEGDGQEYNRRNEIRTPVELPCECYYRELKPFLIVITDISPSGIGLITERELKIDYPLRIMLDLGEGVREVKVRVVNAFPLDKETGYYRYGTVLDIRTKPSNYLQFIHRKQLENRRKVNN